RDAIRPLDLSRRQPAALLRAQMQDDQRLPRQKPYRRFAGEHVAVGKTEVQTAGGAVTDCAADVYDIPALTEARPHGRERRTRPRDLDDLADGAEEERERLSFVFDQRQCPVGIGAYDEDSRTPGQVRRRRATAALPAAECVLQ